MTKDMEMSCDEVVIREMGIGIKRKYSETLLVLAAGHSMIGGVPLAFGEGEVKGRIKNILNYKRPAFWGALCLIVIVFVAAAALMSNPLERLSVKDTEDLAKVSETGTEWLAKAYEWRTEYVGDASAVGNIIGSWKPLTDAVGEGFELQTDTEPYGVTIRYTSKLEPEEVYGNASLILQQNATILFSLIHNLGTITITVNDEAVGYFARSNQEELFGNLWLQSESLEELIQLYDKETFVQFTGESF